MDMNGLLGSGTLNEYEDKTNVLKLVAPYLSPDELLNLKTVSSQVENLVNHTMGDKSILQVDGSKSDNTDPFDKLIKSDVGWGTIKFTEVHLERFLGNALYFEKFSTLVMQTLTSLYLDKVYTSLGRVIELIAFCQKLRLVSIKDSPNLLTTDNHLEGWKDFIPTFYKRMNRINHFHIQVEAESSFGLNTQGMVNRAGLTRWFRCLIQLKELEVNNKNGVFPLDLVLKVINSNVKTLQKLNLQGGVEYDRNACNVLSNLDLHELTIGGYNTDHYSFSKFISTQTNLEVVKFVALIFESQDLKNISKKVEKLELLDCIFKEGSNALSGCRLIENLTDLSIIYKLKEQNAIHCTEILYKPEFQLKLKRITIQTPSASRLLSSIGTLTNLEDLQIINAKMFNSTYADPHVLMKFLWTLNKLKKFTFTNSNFDDPCFFRDDNANLTKLSALEYLDLSNTCIGSDTNTWINIAQMENLRKLIIDNTKIDNNGLLVLVQCRAGYTGLPLHISAQYCKNLRPGLDLENDVINANDKIELII